MDPAEAGKRPVGTLNVMIQRATNLKKAGILGTKTFHPYVKLKMSDDKLRSKKTSVKRKDTNPEWNEDFDILVNDPDSQSLELSVYDWKQVGKHVKIGMSVVPLRELLPCKKTVMTLDILKSTDPDEVQNDKLFDGHLVVELTYKPFDKEEEEMEEDFDEVQKAPASGGLLVVVIHEAQNLRGKHHTNPCARLLFRGQEKITKCVKKNSCPRWTEDFRFILEEPPVYDKVHVQVVSNSSWIGLFHPEECLGYVDISLADVVLNKRIKEKFELIDSENGMIEMEIIWKTSP